MPNARFQFINVAELDLVERWRDAMATPEFASVAEQMTDFHPSPGLYQVIRENHRDT